KVIAFHPIDRNDQVGKEAAIVGRDGALVALERELILLLAGDLPGLGHVLGVLAHAASGDAIFDLRNEKPDIGRAELAKDADALTQIARLADPAHPVGQILPEPKLNPAHALDA